MKEKPSERGQHVYLSWEGKCSACHIDMRDGTQEIRTKEKEIMPKEPTHGGACRSREGFEFGIILMVIESHEKISNKEVL